MMVFLINNRKMTIRVRHILFFAVSLFCISCSDDAPVSSVREYPIEVYLGCDMTKVGVDGNDLFWESGDQVAFRATDASGNSSVAVLTLNDVDSGLGKAKFKGSVEMNSDPVKCEFAYPANAFSMTDGKTVFDYSEQDGTHKPYLYGSVPYSPAGMDCTLGHVGGLIRIKVAAGVESVSLSSNYGSYVTIADGSSSYDGQKISKVTLGAEGTVSATEDASHLIIVSVPDGEDVVYAFVPGLTFTDGLSIVCNAQNGKRFKSFSNNGKADSSYNFTAGSVLDIDMSDSPVFTASCKCSWEHTYDENNILTGTKVTLDNFWFGGAPSKIIDQWGVGIYDEDNNLIRWTYGDGAFDETSKEMLDYTGDWPLVLPGDYSVYAICNINGHTLQFPVDNGMNQVTAPLAIKVAVSGKTSWDYRSTPSKANAMDNDAIVEIGAKVNIHSSILASDKYACKVSFSTTGKSSAVYDMNAADYSSDCVFDGLTWGSHGLEASVTFCGNTFKTASPLPCHITGLPYEADWSLSGKLDDWKYLGNETSQEDKYVKFGKESWNNTDYSGGVISPEFKVPEAVYVVTDMSISGNNTDFNFIVTDKRSFMRFYPSAGTRESTIVASGDQYIQGYYVDALDVSGFVPSYGDYGDYGANTTGKYTLSSTSPCMVYSTVSRCHPKFLHKLKIEYAQ